jgi:uncharacterized RDD family membrane protein YckC
VAPSAAPGAPAAPAGPPVHRSYAGLVSRLSALAVDVALLSAATVAVRMLPKVAWSQVIRNDVPPWIDTGAAVLAWLLPWLYFTLCWWINGQTVGDMLIGVSVRYEDDRDISLFRAAIRAAVGLLVAPLWILGLVYVLWDRRRRALHDLLFGTVVPYTSPPHTVLRAPRKS